MKKELRLSGSGGQGIILAGIIIANAAINEGKNAIQSQSYGPEARGGASKCEVIIKDGDIHFPKVTNPDMILSLTQVAYDKYGSTIGAEGIMIVDSKIKLNDDFPCKNIYQLPILQTASVDIGKPIVGNIVALGVIQKITNIVSQDALLESILSRVPKGTEDLNKFALEKGYELVEKYYG